ncbi:MAG: Nif3-like dinuclear metal center hexameric protein [Marinilabiliales bacterium]|nr:MAG: Nif3-like dinuclear metal center hexameric protein [Marinilabiliales bacterium]
MKVKEIIAVLEEFAPPQLQEDYDNTGLNIGNHDSTITGILLCIDVTPDVINEAIENKCNLIIAHHPLIFGKIKKITGANYVEKSIITAIKNDISIYAGHTSFDSVSNCVSYKICEKLGLENLQILSAKKSYLKKLAVFVPSTHELQVRTALFEAGAGKIGNYDSCSFNTQGKGSFRGNEGTNPFVGNQGVMHIEDEVKIECVFPKHLQHKILKAVLNAHPYEEVAYDIYSLDNDWNMAGLGMIGLPKTSISEKELLKSLKSIFDLTNIRHSNLLNKKIKRIAVCGGSGASFIPDAIRSGADVYITGDIKYHEYFMAENKILLIDIGHFESEQFTKEIFYDIIMKKNPNFAVRFSQIITNPIKNY